MLTAWQTHAAETPAESNWQRSMNLMVHRSDLRTNMEQESGAHKGEARDDGAHSAPAYGTHFAHSEVHPAGSAHYRPMPAPPAVRYRGQPPAPRL